MEIALLSLFLFLGVVFIVLEIFVLPGFGIGGVAGIGFLVAAVLYAFVELGEVAGWVTFGLGVLMLIAGIWLFLKSKMLDKMALNTAIDGLANEPIEGLKEGDEGVARTRLAPMGHVRFGDIEVEVYSEDGFVDAGTTVAVSEVTPQRVVVRVLKIN